MFVPVQSVAVQHPLRPPHAWHCALIDGCKSSAALNEGLVLHSSGVETLLNTLPTTVLKCTSPDAAHHSSKKAPAQKVIQACSAPIQVIKERRTWRWTHHRNSA